MKKNPQGFCLRDELIQINASLTYNIIYTDLHHAISETEINRLLFLIC